MVKKKVFISIVLVLGLLFVSSGVMAAEKQTSSSTINGVTVNWEYELNDSNEIVELKCTNKSDLTGKLDIPSTIDGKTVKSVGGQGFSDSNITEVKIPNSVERIDYGVANSWQHSHDIILSIYHLSSSLPDFLEGAKEMPNYSFRHFPCVCLRKSCLW